MMRAAAIATALMALATAQDVQKPRTLREASKAIHAAWLREVMDADVPAAVRAYTAIAANEDANNLPRWIAVARLLELQRLGVAVPTLGLDQAAPAPLRPALESCKQPLPVAIEAMLRQTTQPPEQVMQSVGRESERLPLLRPGTAAAQDWVRDRLRARAYERRPRQGTPLRNRPDRARIERAQAADILQREIEGRQEQAENLRKIYFTEWRPPAIPADELAAIDRVRLGLDTWLADKETSTAQKNLLRSLRTAFDARAATSPAAALTFLARMPLYADRLLGAPAGAASSNR